MTPQERQLVDDLFDRLAKLETAPRDPDAERAIIDGLRRAPNAVYALVQTALVQDEALKRADAKIRELSGAAEPQQQGGFLDTMRNALMGTSHTSVPTVGSGAASAAGGPDPRWNQGGAYQGGYQAAGPAGSGYAPSPGLGGGGSFLGTAAASAAGMIGGVDVRPSRQCLRLERRCGAARLVAMGHKRVEQQPGAGRRPQRHRQQPARRRRTIC